MPTGLPMACSLSATELPERLAEIADLGRAGLLGVERAGTAAVLRFRPGAGNGERLAAIVAAEARCCPFLEMTLRDHDDVLALTIDGPADARPVVDGLVAAFG